jgi:hypothetical protein
MIEFQIVRDILIGVGLLLLYALIVQWIRNLD